MKYLFLFISLVLMSACTPKYEFGQKVTYQVPKFYTKLCTGKGTITDYYFWMVGYRYLIKDDNYDLIHQRECLLVIPEWEIK